MQAILPLRAGESQPSDRAPSSKSSVEAVPVMRAVRPRRVLIVEDNLDTVRSFALLLREMGHQVEYAINGYAGIEVARRYRP